MKIIDEKGKLFGKINVIDFLVVVAVFVLAMATFIKFDNGDGSGNSMSKDTVIEYTLLVRGVRQPTIDAINKKKDGIVDNATKKEIGDIIDIKTMPSVGLEMLNDGKYKEVEYKDKYDVLLTIQVKGTETKNNYYTSTGQKLVVGEGIGIYNDYVVTTGGVKSIKVLK